MQRARETAEIVNSFLRMEVNFFDELCEADEYPLPHVPRHLGPFDALASSPPDEIYQAFRRRIEGAMRWIVDTHPEGTVLVVAHGGSLES